jgi:CspA family cold shock protein
MAVGKVKWFNNAKGYGFILPDGGGDDLFAHYSSIEMEGYKTLKAGQDVEFDILEGPKGYHAINIRAESSESEPSDEDAPIDTSAAEDPEPAEASPPAQETSREVTS